MPSAMQGGSAERQAARSELQVHQRGAGASRLLPNNKLGCSPLLRSHVVDDHHSVLHSERAWRGVLQLIVGQAEEDFARLDDVARIANRG